MRWLLLLLFLPTAGALQITVEPPVVVSDELAVQYTVQCNERGEYYPDAPRLKFNWTAPAGVAVEVPGEVDIPIDCVAQDVVQGSTRLKYSFSPDVPGEKRLAVDLFAELRWEPIAPGDEGFLQGTGRVYVERPFEAGLEIDAPTSLADGAMIRITNVGNADLMVRATDDSGYSLASGTVILPWRDSQEVEVIYLGQGGLILQATSTKDFDRFDTFSIEVAPPPRAIPVFAALGAVVVAVVVVVAAIWGWRKYR